MICFTALCNSLKRNRAGRDFTFGYGFSIAGKKRRGWSATAIYVRREKDKNNKKE